MSSFAGQLLVAGRIPGERVATTIETADSATFTAETTVLSVVAPLISGRLYQVRAVVRMASTVANDDVTGRIREDNLAGTSIQEENIELTHDLQASRGQAIWLEVEYEAAATGDKTFVLTGERAAGSGDCRLEATAAKPMYFYVNYLSG